MEHSLAYAMKRIDPYEASLAMVTNVSSNFHSQQRLNLVYIPFHLPNVHPHTSHYSFLMTLHHTRTRIAFVLPHPHMPHVTNMSIVVHPPMHPRGTTTHPQHWDVTAVRVHELVYYPTNMLSQNWVVVTMWQRHLQQRQALRIPQWNEIPSPMAQVAVMVHHQMMIIYHHHRLVPIDIWHPLQYTSYLLLPLYNYSSSSQQQHNPNYSPVPPFPHISHNHHTYYDFVNIYPITDRRAIVHFGVLTSPRRRMIRLSFWYVVGMVIHVRVW